MRISTLTIMMAAGLLVWMTGCASPPRGRPIAWDVLKGKTGDAANTPLIEKGNVVLRGQDVRTQRTYSAPVTIEFEAQPVKRGAEAGLFTCLFVAVNQPADADPKEFVSVTLQSDQ